MRRSRPGFLLVEASLAIVIIAVGVVFVSRGLGSSLKGLAVLTQYDALLYAAESLLSDLEARAEVQPPLEVLQGDCEGQSAACRWELVAQTLEIEALEPGALQAVTLIVSRGEDVPPVVRLQTVWPSQWVREQ